MDLGLEGRTVLVTGGSAGLGRATAELLVAEGANVAICARDPQRLELAERSMRPGRGQIFGIPADVSVAGNLERFVSSALDRFGRIDALVNNAGGGAARPFAEISEEDWEHDLRVKLFASIRASALVLPHLEKAGGGAVVNVLAISAKAPAGGSAPSSVTRAAQLALTKSLSKEVGPKGIRVNAVLVGVIRASGHDRRAAASELGPEGFYAALAHERQVPLGRVGNAEEFANVVAFLVSPASSYVTGVGINVDGGASAVV